jgi:hypothetical protein
LTGTSRHGDRSHIHIAVEADHNAYVSTDHGHSWQFNGDAMFGVVNLSVITLRTGTAYYSAVANANRSLVWTTKGPAGLSLSRNNGRSWEEWLPRLAGGGTIRTMMLIGPGTHADGTLYAQIRLTGADENWALYRSEDYGRTFLILSTEVRYAVESRASRNVLVGLNWSYGPWAPRALVSRDRGRTWSTIRSSSVIMEPLFGGDGGLKTWMEPWKEKNADVPRYNDVSVKQIETDPSDENVFYFVTEKGLYVTRDGGESVKLLPLAVEYYDPIENMAVDPFDPRYLYAVARQTELYGSSDRGCTWSKLAVPGR